MALSFFDGNNPTTAEYEAGGYDGNQSDHASLPSARCQGLLQTAYRRPPNHPFLRYKMSSRGTTLSAMAYLFMTTVLLHCFITPASAVFVQYQNCLPQSYQNSQSLQFVPLYVNVIFNSTDPSHNLDVTVWGNVTGTLPISTDPLPLGTNTSYWNNPNNTVGKIVDVPDPSGADVKTSFFRKVDALTYQPFQAEPADFCDSLINGTCPLGPVFPENDTTVVPFYDLPSFALTNSFFSSYAFTSLAATLRVNYGDEELTSICCVSAIITPDLGDTLRNVIRYIPLVILGFVGFATAFAGIFSPWGTTDTFRWTTNYGRDADLLRLVTPGFGDCLQYIQFVVLTGSLTLAYPGYYQPVVSQASWSILMFNQSLVSQGNGTQSLIDGIYVTNSTHGLGRLSQLVGMSSVEDVWAGMAVWLLAILAGVIILIQIGFALRWVHRQVTNIQEEDLRAKNIPFSVGNVIRIVFNYLYLPIVALSMFQLVVASSSPAYAVALAVIMLFVLIGFAGWLFHVIARAKPRSFLFDDLSTVLTYGSLYNTYSDDAAAFAIIPLFLTLLRGVAIGAIQPSGIAQIIVLAICEVVTLLTLHAFKPFHSPTSMNAYHTIFAIVRLATILLLLAFAPSLGVTEGPKGWIGYVILLMHAVVLILGFFLNSLQTIVEVGARMAGAGDNETGATRGGLTKVFGMRQLSRRLPRRDAVSRASQSSRAAMLATADMDGAGRARSQSAGSIGLLANRQSAALESNNGVATSSYTPTSGGEQVLFSYLPAATAAAAAAAGSRRTSRGPIIGLSTVEAADPYYRPPRARRPTLENGSPAIRSRGSWASNDWSKRWSQPQSPDEGPSISGRATPNPMHLPNVFDPNAPRADYTTREVDFYYGVRGPALNGERPGRRMQTGPTNPTNPINTAVNTASGFFKGIFGGKTKEKNKGFEVVRSSRMPPGMARARAGLETPPEGIPVATDAARHGPIDSDDEDEIPHPRAHGSGLDGAHDPVLDEAECSPLTSDDDEEYRDEVGNISRISDIPPSLPGVDFGDGIELPRMSSKASRVSRNTSSAAPQIPKKNSKRHSRGTSLTDNELMKGRLPNQPPGGLLYDPHVPHHKAQISTDSTKRFSSTSASSSPSKHPDIGIAIHTDSALGNLRQARRSNRPISIGSVQHHSPQTVDNSNAEFDFLGSSAEVFGDENGNHAA